MLRIYRNPATLILALLALVPAGILTWGAARVYEMQGVSAAFALMVVPAFILGLVILPDLHKAAKVSRHKCLVLANGACWSVFLATLAFAFASGLEGMTDVRLIAYLVAGVFAMLAFFCGDRADKMIKTALGD